MSLEKLEKSSRDEGLIRADSQKSQGSAFAGRALNFGAKNKTFRDGEVMSATDKQQESTEN